jgi:hypothetical protein
VGVGVGATGVGVGAGREPLPPPPQELTEKAIATTQTLVERIRFCICTPPKPLNTHGFPERAMPLKSFHFADRCC